ncbi:MAG: antitoxin Xre/MbcA/ParS toxin-binding domain-containing protein [Steroidobacteraceae bacterium]
MEPAPHSDSQKRRERVVLAQALMRLFDLWGLGSADRLALLGLSEGNRTALQRYASGEPLAASRDLLDRAGHLLGIHKSLKLLFPRNEEIARGWMSTRNAPLGGETPVEIVKRYGLPGLAMVRGRLDVMRAH